jgi:hypothetical protein
MRTGAPIAKLLSFTFADFDAQVGTLLVPALNPAGKK